MTFTIEQLEALKEGTTPGPWKFREHPDYEYPAGPEWGPMQTELEHAVLDTEDNHLFGTYNNYKLIEHPGNLPLAAASPALLDQLIATEMKLQKVFKSIEGLRTECLDVVFHEGSGHEEYTGNEAAELIEEAHYKALTQILEGNA